MEKWLEQRQAHTHTPHTNSRKNTKLLNFIWKKVKAKNHRNIFDEIVFVAWMHSLIFSVWSFTVGEQIEQINDDWTYASDAVQMSMNIYTFTNWYSKIGLALNGQKTKWRQTTIRNISTYFIAYTLGALACIHNLQLTQYGPMDDFTSVQTISPTTRWIGASVRSDCFLFYAYILFGNSFTSRCRYALRILLEQSGGIPSAASRPTDSCFFCFHRNDSIVEPKTNKINANLSIGSNKVRVLSD